jgi:hypothetical protein
MTAIGLPALVTLPTAPDGLPVLGAGRHADPGQGACFMEFASVLAGEPFSDHP